MGREEEATCTLGLLLSLLPACLGGIPTCHHHHYLEVSSGRSHWVLPGGGGRSQVLPGRVHRHPFS